MLSPKASFFQHAQSFTFNVVSNRKTKLRNILYICVVE